MHRSLHNVGLGFKRLTSFIPGIIISRNEHSGRSGWRTLSLACGAIFIVIVLTSCGSSASLQRTSNPRLNRVLAEAEDLVGTTYCSSGTTPECFDCSGFTSWCFTRAGIRLPRASREQFTAGVPVVPVEATSKPTPLIDPDLTLLEPGDLVFFITFGTEVSHVGIYGGNDGFIHSSTSKGVIVSSMHESYWRSRFVGARRILPP